MDETPSGAFLLKARCRCKARLTIQIRIKHGENGLHYSYQLFSGKDTLLRWDNAPHFPDLKNYPHHFHNPRGERITSDLTGDPLKDLSHVLQEIEKYLET